MNIHNSQKWDTSRSAVWIHSGEETSLIRPLKSSWCGSWKHLEIWLVDVESQTVHWLLKWVHALPHCVPTCDELEQFTGVHTGTPQQHKDIQQSTRSRDNKERSIFVGWLQAHHHLLDTKLIAWSPCQLASSLAYLLIGTNLYKSA